MVAIMEEPVDFQEYALALLVGMEVAVPYVSEVITISCVVLYVCI